MLIEKRNLVIAGLALGVVAMIIASIIGFTSGKSNNQQSGTDVYVDPSSGETIVTDNRAAHGSEASLKNAIIYPGFSKLLDRGLSPTEIQSIQSTIEEYSLTQKNRFTEVSLVVDSMRYIQSAEDPEVSPLTFSIKVNRKDDYYITSTPKGGSESITKLYASDKTTLLLER